MLTALLAHVVLSQQPALVTVRCHEPCSVKLDGRTGRRVDEKTWEVEGVAAGSKKLEAMSASSGPIFVGWVDLPQGNAKVDLDEKGKPTVAVAPAGPLSRALAAAPPPPPPPPPPTPMGAAGPSAPPMVAAPGAPSLVRVRCQNDCTVKVGGTGGRRVNSQFWEFENVKAGTTRIESEGFAGMKQASGFVEVPSSSEVEVVVSSGRVALGTVKPREAQLKAASGGVSVIVVNCPKSCTVFMDGQRRSSEGVNNARIPNVAPGRHSMQVKYLGGAATSDVEVPGDSEVFVVPGEGSLRVTATKPLSR